MPRESKDAQTKRAAKITAGLKKQYPEPECALQFRNPFELLVATILAAQCTDERVNIVTKDLFRKYSSPADFAALAQDKLEKEIHSTGFFRNKAKAIKALAEELIARHGSKVPGTMEELVALPGVGRKTASVVLGNCFGQPAVVVDTHVKRVAARLGLTANSNPDKIEADLKALLPEKDWWHFCNALTWHGRRFCFARKPDCPACPIAAHCLSAGKV